MTLRSFHLVFVTVCMLLFGFLLAWSLLWADVSRMQEVVQVTSVVGLLLAPIYGWYFLRKSKDLVML